MAKKTVVLLLLVLVLFAVGCDESSSGYVNKGNAKQLSKQYDKAIQDYTKAIELDGKNADAYFQRAKVYNLQGKTQKAIDDFKVVVQLDPKGEKGKKAKQMVEELKMK